jgi:hypothetical protein
MNKKLKYVIDIATFLPSSGGICTMHRLCHDINSLGETAYITSPITHPSLNAPYVGSMRFAKDEVVVIYPEITHGNPLNAKNVVRWILNVPGESFYDKLAPNDLLLKYSESYKLRQDCQFYSYLRTTFSDKLGIFYNTNETRSGSTFFVKKGGMKLRMHPDDSIDLKPYQNNHEEMANLFRKVKYFYCYDSYCYLACLANLCGCIVIITPPEKETFEEYTKNNPQTKYGIAFGLENLDHAKKTIHLVAENYKKVKEAEFETVKNFIKICEEKFAIN